MSSPFSPHSILLPCLTLTLFVVNPAFGQTSPSITNVTNAANPSINFPILTPGGIALIIGTNLAASTASSAPPRSLLGGVEVHLVGISGEIVAGLVYVSPTGISFVVPNFQNGAEMGDTRVVIVKNGRRFDDLTTPGLVLIDALYIESSPNPALSDQPVTFTAHVGVIQSLYHPTIGAVTFMDGVTPLGTLNLSNVTTFADSSLLRHYDVSFTSSKLAAGDHSIWVGYGGDNMNKPSTSGVITQSVQTPEVTIWSGPNPSIHGNTVTVAATVLPATCTGSMVFFDEFETLGTATVNSGRAFIQTSSLPVGSHPITVRYSGDSSCPALVYGPANDFMYHTTSQTVNP
jgi:hypothetical protein